MADDFRCLVSQANPAASSHNQLAYPPTSATTPNQGLDPFFDDDDELYAKTDTPALCRTSSLVEELGQVEYVFSDKVRFLPTFHLPS